MKTCSVDDVVKILDDIEDGKIPVYVSCSFNYYQICRLIKFSDHVVIELGDVDNSKNEGSYEV